jgi:protein-S-isoprenylcysteine O-methyltransferase Ste14
MERSGDQASLHFLQLTGMTMTDSVTPAVATAPDRPPILVFPPVIPLATLAVALLLQWLAPLGWIAQIDPIWRIGGGALCLIAGALVTIAGRRTMIRHGTNVNPRQPSTALVTEGIFERTRNPLYVGIIIAQYAVAIIFALDWLLLLIVPGWVILHFAVVRHEESYLEQKFGDAYRRYKARVPRYLLGF